MGGTASSRFYWNDWQGDPALRLCSLAAQGLWMRMLCIAAEADPIGYVSIGSKPVGATDLAKIAGVSEAEVTSLMAELDRYGVFSRDRHSRIYSRRMVRDARKSAEAKKNGKLGGNPNIGNDREKSRVVNPQDNPRDKPPIPVPIPSEEKTEAKASSKKKAKTAIDSDWRPSDEDREHALAKHLDPDSLTGEFVDYHLREGTLSADWRASWRTWCRNAVRFRDERRKPNDKRGGPTGFAALVLEQIGEGGRG